MLPLTELEQPMSPLARRTEQVASDIAWTLCAAGEIRLRLMLARKTASAKQRSSSAAGRRRVGCNVWLGVTG
jgi:hypothetical protein